MEIIFSEFAGKELDDVVRYHELEGFPKAWSVVRGDVRKCLLHRFPYNLLYSIGKDHIL